MEDLNCSFITGLEEGLSNLCSMIDASFRQPHRGLMYMLCKERTSGLLMILLVPWQMN